MKVKPKNYWEFDIQKVMEKYGAVKYINDFPIDDLPFPIAIYKSDKNYAKRGHKEFFGLSLRVDPCSRRRQMVIGEFTRERLKPWQHVPAVMCLKCNDIAYSTFRYDCAMCECGSAGVDGGGGYYTRVLGVPSEQKRGRVNLLTGLVTFDDD